MAKDVGPALKALEAVNLGASTISAYSSARTQRSQAFYDAKMASLEAEDVNYRGNTAAAQKEAQADRAVGTVKAKIAGRGFNTGAGTARDVTDATDFVSRLDALTIRSNTARAVAAKNAEAAGAAARARSINPGMEAAGTLIGGATTVAARWYERDKLGPQPAQQPEKPEDEDEG